MLKSSTFKQANSDSLLKGLLILWVICFRLEAPIGIKTNERSNFGTVAASCKGLGTSMSYIDGSLIVKTSYARYHSRNCRVIMFALAVLESISWGKSATQVSRWHKTEWRVAIVLLTANRPGTSITHSLEVALFLRVFAEPLCYDRCYAYVAHLVELGNS